MRRSDRDGGFSLLELLAVLALLALAAGLALPRAGAGLERAALREAAGALAGHLLDARRMARQAGVPVLAEALPGALRLRASGRAERVLPVAGLDAGPAARFLPSGAAEPARFRLAARGLAFAVEVEPFLGGVRILRDPDG